MLTATVKIRNQWNREEIKSEEIEFETIGQMEDYLAYNRAYIQEMKFTGKFTREQN